jgi:hypothetical protein
MFEWIASVCGRRDAVWDCATGNGQAAGGIAPHFARVVATDISVAQLAHAVPRDNIRYCVCSAEEPALRHDAFDLVIVAQALHWLDFDRFWPAVSRVARANALFVAWGYDWSETTPELEASFVAPFREIVHPFWAANNRIVWRGYRTDEVRFPYPRIDAPPFALEVDWTVAQLVEYMKTWSAYTRSRSDPAAVRAMDALMASTRALRESPRRFDMRIPLYLLAGRITAPAGL